MKTILKSACRLSMLTFVSLVLSFLGACSTSLKLPPKSKDMEKVYLLKYLTWGHHSLAFYRNGHLTEFTYGDWELFALNKRDSWTAFKNMTFFTPGALGRKSVALEAGDSICDKFKGCVQIVPFMAPKAKVSELWNRLQKLYEQNAQTEVYNENEEVFFVKYDRPYWGFHNCNHELADWLEEIGGEVSGKIFYNPRFIEGMSPRQAPITYFSKD
ncbi:MAG: hypothetical protein HQM13_23690 [SAR324 cluster bacterium]|nr:hypothetical protein [SAR324 cluster bacterium]